MVDLANITVKAGDGGRGAGSFHRIKGKRRGKADGGSGGDGGNVFFEATRDLNTLEPFRYLKDFKAKDGAHGASNLKHGANGEDLVLKVPVGTIIIMKSQDISYDLAEDGQKILVARGGEGGRGNAYLRDEFSRRPRQGEKGVGGELVELTLELKLIADVGLIGLPNAGKSTLCAALTAAKVEIAPYPFTTLEPNLGVVTKDFKKGKRNIILADIPGLIEGASKGKGLGDVFLRHIERTKILVHLIDISSESLKWEDYQRIRAELKNYSTTLTKKREIIVFTKIDLVPKSVVVENLAYFKKKKKKVMDISAVTGENLKDLVVELSNTLKKLD